MYTYIQTYIYRVNRTQSLYLLNLFKCYFIRRIIDDKVKHTNHFLSFGIRLERPTQLIKAH